MSGRALNMYRIKTTEELGIAVAHK